jgi:16S rRNA (cytosine1402-N4)-methyltransferase
MHQPVLLDEVMEHLAVKPGGTYIDGTVGGGGHAAAMAERAGAGGRLLGLDQDDTALALARSRLQPFPWVRVEYGNFADMKAMAQREGFAPADGILLDIGVSSMQLDTAERGFSFQHDAALDMRMDRRQGRTAADLVNTMGGPELAELLWTLGEERASRRIARFIEEARAKAPLRTTGQLADLVTRAKGGRRGRLHPATQTFQALRMAVNDELGALRRGLAGALDLLRPGGRLAVISFHSLEDRVVKQTFAAHAGRWESLPAGGERWVGEAPAVTWVVKSPVMASEREVAENPRARSAKLRVVERTN